VTLSHQQHARNKRPGGPRTCRDAVSVTFPRAGALVLGVVAVVMVRVVSGVGGGSALAADCAA
jgi:hypothetical protein